MIREGTGWAGRLEMCLLKVRGDIHKREGSPSKRQYFEKE